MSFLEENADVKMDSGNPERAEPQCGSEDPAREPLEPGPSRASLSFARAGEEGSESQMRGGVHGTGTTPTSLGTITSAPSGIKVVTEIPKKFIIRDRDHKVLLLDSGTLRAVPERPYIHPEIISTLPCRFNSDPERQGSPIFLAVSEGKRCLCCKVDGEKSQPTLQLKRQNLCKLIHWKEEASKPFTFYRAEVCSWNTLESAAHPGWFICTSCNLTEPVGMTNNSGQKEYTDFSFEPV